MGLLVSSMIWSMSARNSLALFFSSLTPGIFSDLAPRQARLLNHYLCVPGVRLPSDPGVLPLLPGSGPMTSVFTWKFCSRARLIFIKFSASPSLRKSSPCTTVLRSQLSWYSW